MAQPLPFTITPSAYRVLRTPRSDRDILPGTIVYDYLHCDYGCASDDNEIFGGEHTTVTQDKNGGNPFFTILITDLEPIKQEETVI